MAGKTKYFNYDPSVVAAAVATALFGITTIIHLWQMCRRRTWYFTAFVVGGFFEVFGFGTRIINAIQNPDYTKAPYIVQTLLILLAPALFAASIYMILSRLIRLTEGEHLSFIRSTWLTKIFVLGDVLSFLAQGAGGGQLASAKTADGINKGEIMITAGLVIQLLFFALFILVSILYNVRLRRNPTEASRRTPWQLYFVVLYVVSGLVLIRSVFRLVEYQQGQDGELLSKEVYLYVFDAALMFAAMVVFNIWHPGRIIAPKHALQKVAHLDPESGSNEHMMQNYQYGGRSAGV